MNFDWVFKKSVKMKIRAVNKMDEKVLIHILKCYVDTFNKSCFASSFFLKVRYKYNPSQLVMMCGLASLMPRH